MKGWVPELDAMEAVEMFFEEVEVLVDLCATDAVVGGLSFDIAGDALIGVVIEGVFLG
jgi:hypothetical protein